MKKTIAVTAFALTLILACLSVAAAQTRDDILREIDAKRAEIAALEKKVLEPSEADRQAHAEFLAGNDTGLFRLMPRELYDSWGKRALTLRGGGAYYSFVSLTSDYGQGSDISLEQGKLSVGFAGADYGMLLNVGDIALDQVTSEHAAVRALLAYTPPTKERDIRDEQRKSDYGVELSGFTFKRSVPAKAANTYLLRSISPDRSDLAVGLRVVREDTDGSLIIVYKVMKRLPATKMERTATASN